MNNRTKYFFMLSSCTIFCMVLMVNPQSTLANEQQNVVTVSSPVPAASVLHDTHKVIDQSPSSLTNPVQTAIAANRPVLSPNQSASSAATLTIDKKSDPPVTDFVTDMITGAAMIDLKASSSATSESLSGNTSSLSATIAANQTATSLMQTTEGKTLDATGSAQTITTGQSIDTSGITKSEKIPLKEPVLAQQISANSLSVEHSLAVPACNCSQKSHSKPYAPTAPTNPPANSSAPVSPSIPSGNSFPSTPLPLMGQVLSAAATILPVAGNHWFFIAFFGNIVMMLLGSYLRLRSGRSPGYSLVYSQ